MTKMLIIGGVIGIVLTYEKTLHAQDARAVDQWIEDTQTYQSSRRTQRVLDDAKVFQTPSESSRAKNGRETLFPIDPHRQREQEIESRCLKRIDLTQ